MKQRIILTAMALLMGFTMFAQVKDVSFTVSPYGEYVWWNSKTTLDNTPFWGARAGFSFGPLFEIRGFYQQSADVEASLRKLDWSITDDWADKMTKSHVDMKRYGGEMKLNMMHSRVFAPYITVGGGVQRLNYLMEDEALLDPFKVKEEHIFASVGLGTKFNLSDRVVLSLEAKHTFFNVNDKSYYLSPDFTIGEDDSKRLGNWSAMASLDFYLGGNKSSKNEVHNAYKQLFSDGFAGVKFVVEPSMMYVKLKDDALFEEQYFLGGAAGLDFSSLVGIRGFYYKATEDPNKLSLKFNNKMEMYGGNLIARLSQPSGINPYLTLGGGYIKTNNKYVNHLEEMGDQSRGFVMGGLGLEIPLSRYVALYGSINAMLSNKGSKDLAAIEGPKQVKADMMYQTGVRFNIGKPIDADAYYDRSLERALMTERELNNEKINELRSEYEGRIQELNKEIERAAKKRDFDEVSRIEEEKRAVIEEYRAKQPSQDDYLRLTEEELSRIVKEAVRETRREEAVAPDMTRPQVQPVPVVPAEKLVPATPVVAAQKVEEPVVIEEAVELLPAQSLDDATAKRLAETEKRIAAAEQRAAEAEKRAAEAVAAAQVQPVAKEATVSPSERELSALNRVIETQTAELAAQSQQIAALTASLDDASSRAATVATAATVAPVAVAATAPRVKTKRDPVMKLRGISALGAMDFGSKTYWNVGLRGHWQIKESDFELMPEMFMGFGHKKDGFGVSANVVYRFGSRYDKLRPYVGLGVGGFPGKKTVWGTNILGGVSYDLALGSVFADYSIRSVFKQNQLAIGYRISF